MDSRNTRLIKNTAILFVGNIATKLIAFFMVPLYTHFISPTQYGEIDLYLTVFSILYVVVSFQAIESAFRFIHDAETDNEKVKVITNAVIIATGGFLSFLILSVVANYFLSFNNFVIILLYVFAAIFSQLFMQIIRGLSKTTSYMLIGLGSAVLMVTINIFAIVYFKLNPIVLLISPIIINLLVIIYTLFINRMYKFIIPKLVSMKEITRQLRFGLPLMPNAISIWLLASIGRFVLLYFYDNDAVGLLAVALKIPLMVESLVSIFHMAWQTNAIYSEEDLDKNEYYNQIYYNLFRIILLVISILLPVIVLYYNYLINSSFHGTMQSIPIFFIGLIFKTLAEFFNSIFYSNKNTKHIFQATLVGAIINFIFAILLIPHFFIVGVAIAYAIAEIVHFIIIYVKSRKYIKVEFINKNFVLPLFLIVVSVIIYYSFANSILVLLFASFIISIISLIIYKNIVLLILKKIGLIKPNT